MAGKVRDQRLDEIGDGVALRHDRRHDVELLRGFGRHRPDRGDDGGAQEIDRLIVSEYLDEVTDG